MSNIDEHTPEQHVGSPPTLPTAPPEFDVENNSPPTEAAASPVADVEKNNPPTGPAAPPVADAQIGSNGTSHEVARIVQRLKREEFVERCLLALTGLAFLFSFLSFIVIASNNHGEIPSDPDSLGLNFNDYPEYRYLLAAAILSTLYTGWKATRQAYELWARKNLFQKRISAFLDFFGDQIMAYLLISALSSAVPRTNELGQLMDELFIYPDSLRSFRDSSAASISMAFFAFVALALSAVASGYRLAAQSSI